MVWEVDADAAKGLVVGCGGLLGPRPEELLVQGREGEREGCVVQRWVGMAPGRDEKLPLELPVVQRRRLNNYSTRIPTSRVVVEGAW